MKYKMHEMLLKLVLVFLSSDYRNVMLGNLAFTFILIEFCIYIPVNASLLPWIIIIQVFRFLFNANQSTR